MARRTRPDTAPEDGAEEAVDEAAADPTGARRCLVTGDRKPRDALIRFVLDPEGWVTPDLAETLPGRGLWLSAHAGTIKTACDRRLFARAAKAKAEASADLPERVEALLARRVSDLLSLARRAGEAVAGFEKADAALKGGRAALLIQASDGAEDGRRKLLARVPSRTERGVGAKNTVCEVFACMTADELGRAFGRDQAVHVAVSPGGLCEKLRRDCARLSGLRGSGV